MKMGEVHIASGGRNSKSHNKKCGYRDAYKTGKKNAIDHMHPLRYL